MPLQRKEQWEVSFHEFLLARASIPFAWGTNDCCIFPADAIEAITGQDIATDFRGKYTDQSSAFALLESVTMGGKTVADAAAHCASLHGIRENQHPLMAKRGDLVAINNGGALICGVIHLNGRHVVSVTDTGLVRLPISSVVRSWSY